MLIEFNFAHLESWLMSQYVLCICEDMDRKSIYSNFQAVDVGYCIVHYWKPAMGRIML